MTFARFLANKNKFPYNTNIKPVLTWVHNKLYLFAKEEKEEAEELKRPRGPRLLLKLAWASVLDVYGFPKLHISMVSKEDEIITIPTNCRDYVNEAIRSHVTEGDLFSHHVTKDCIGKMDYDNLRMVLLLDVPLNPKIPILDGIKNGLRVADMYGRVAGWKGLYLTQCLVKRGKEDSLHECYLIAGDKNWQRTPQFISMLLLLIRVCLVHEVPSWIKDAYSLQGYWHEALDIRTLGAGTPVDFTDFLYASYDKLLTLVAHEREIFPHDIHGGYDARLRGFHLRSGLNSLVKNNSTHPKSAKKLKTLYMEVIENVGRQD